MIINPVTSLLRWLVCHLVAISFLGFALYGLLTQVRLYDAYEGLVEEASTPLGNSISGDEGQNTLDHPDEALSAQITTHEQSLIEQPEKTQRIEQSEEDMGVASLSGEIQPVQEAGQDSLRLETDNRQIQPSETEASATLEELQPEPASRLELVKPSAAVKETSLVFRSPEPFEEEKLRNKQLNREQLLQAARRAYWNKEPESAVDHYQDYLERFPDDADVFGELGNLYQTMDAQEEALNAFFHAGQLLKQQGNMDRVMDVAKLLQAQGDPRSSELKSGLASE